MSRPCFSQLRVLLETFICSDRCSDRISVRSSLNSPYGAGNLCKSFGGGGREKAGGINNLENSDLDKFKKEFDKVFS